jgi:predicted dehydrogenase/threonine dehydrogenase-like Zn-dependent dehydrogenase
MRQIAQRIKDGKLRVFDVPTPEVDEWKVLVRTEASLVSAGTERAKVETARETLLGKARRRPDQVRQVVDKLRSDGVGATIDAVRSRLEAWSPLGYSATGTVERVGSHVRDVRPGDRVACGGEEAAHAEVLAVPGNLCVPVPDGVDAAAAAFTTVGAIAMHGFRQGGTRLGERVAVVGLGLVGQLTARIAHAAGCKVVGIDLEDWRVELAEAAGVLDVGRRRDQVSDGDLGQCDAVLVTAAAAGSNDPVSLATDLARERGRIVIVGDVRLDLDRRRLYAKELEVRVARSYGPGRYDVEYEQRGLDYPVAYVRWTERRNMAEFLELLADAHIVVDDLVTHRFAIDDADRAYDVLTEPAERAVGVLIEYPQTDGTTSVGVEVDRARAFAPGAGVGFVGAGSFARRHLIPLAREHGLSLERVATASGLSASTAAEQFAFRQGAATIEEILADESVHGVVVATRHDQHARLALDALQAGKAVFVEKPLCLTPPELDELRAELDRDGAPPLMVGFNRRHAPLTGTLEGHLRDATGPTNVIVRVNAGPLPDDHWLNDPVVGGGRLLGEACHFLDLIVTIVKAVPVAVNAQARTTPDAALQSAQDFTVTLRFDDGSLGTLLYGTTGAPDLGKEFVEAHRGSRTAVLDDFRALRLYGGGRTRTVRSRSRDKGHSREMGFFAAVLRGETSPPSAASYLKSTAATLAALQALETGVEQRID